jgi:ankyrin repeat protein
MGQNKELDTRLLQLAASGDVDRARQAIRDGADPLARGAEGKTGLHFAINYSEYNYTSKGREMLAIFLNRGVDINTGDESGATPLHYAALDSGYVAGYKFDDLFKFGADVEARDKKGQTPLHHAARRGKGTEAIKALLNAGADVNARDESGATPLHMAAARGDEDVIKLLLSAGANIQAQTRYGQNVWNYGIDNGKDYQAQCLKAEFNSQLRAERLKEQQQALKREEEKKIDPWKLLAADKVAFSKTEKQIGYQITEVFNFAARTYTQISQNLTTRSEAVAVKTFDEFDDKTGIERAFNELQRLGGKAERETIAGPVVEKPRKGLNLPKAS